MASTPTITTASSTHTGGVRHKQLDAAATLALPGDRHLIAAADGVTTDVQSLVAEGQPTSEEAASHPERASLNRALAAGAPTEPDYIVRTVTSDARLVLHLDGIRGPVRPAEIVRIVQSAAAPVDACEHLVNAALGAGGPDNIAVAVADIGL